MWYPLSATTQRIQAAADLWSNVSQNHDEHADPKDVSLARYLSFSLRAAGIRIRDASDQYHKQLRAAVREKSQDGNRFSNVPDRTSVVKGKSVSVRVDLGGRR